MALDCTPQELLANATCFDHCLSSNQLRAIMVWLLCQMDNALNTPGGLVVTLQPANLGLTLGGLNNNLVHPAPATVYSVFGYNNNLNPQFIQLYDAAALPADGAAAPFILLAGGQQQFSWDFGDRGLTFSNGVVVCNSSTAATKTIGALDCKFQIAFL